MQKTDSFKSHEISLNIQNGGANGDSQVKIFKQS